MRSRSMVIGFCALFGTATAVACGSESEPAAAPPHESVDAAQQQPAGHEGHAGMPEMPAMPDSAEPAGGGSAWVELKETRDSIAQLIESGKLADVHQEAERLERMGQALAAGAMSLPEDKRTRIEATLRQLPAVAKALDETGDSGDADATRRELKRLEGLLALIEAQYPADALAQVPAPAEAEGDRPHSEAEPAGQPHGAHTHATRPLAAVDDAPTATLHVKSGEFTFAPKSLTMHAGEPTRIELENEGAVEHSLVVAAPDGKGDWIHLHALARASDAGTFRIDRAGKYPVLCTIAGHTEAGMIGELVVQ